MPDVRLPTVLRQHAGGASVVQAPGETVGQVLVFLEATYPGLRGQLLTADGSPHKFVNVYVDDDDARYLEGLETKLAGTEEISILPAVAGG